MIHSRPYRGTQDTLAMRDMLVFMRASIGHGCWHVGDLVWRLFLQSIRHDLGQTLRLWEDSEGNLLGFAIFSPPRTTTSSFDLQVHPQARGGGLEDQMLDWVEMRWCETRQSTQAGPEGRLVADPGVYADDTAQIAALESRGWVRGENERVLLIRPLNEPIPISRMPEGFTARHVAGEHEVENRAAAHREAFHPSRVTDTSYLRLMQTPGYIPELDLVAVAPDGVFAAFGLGWIDPVNKVGEFEPVGTRPAFRRKGLARAVLLEGLQRMKACGAESAIIGPIDPTEDAAFQLYQSLGFRALHRVYSYAKNI